MTQKGSVGKSGQSVLFSRNATIDLEKFELLIDKHTSQSEISHLNINSEKTLIANTGDILEVVLSFRKKNAPKRSPFHFGHPRKPFHSPVPPLADKTLDHWTEFLKVLWTGSSASAYK